MNDFPLQSLLEDLIDIFDTGGIEYMVMGGIAVRFWGIPRPTFDLDFTLASAPEDIPSLCGLLSQEGFSVSPAYRDGFVDELKGMRKMNVVKYLDGKETGVDLFLVTTTYQQTAFDRRTKRAINAREAWMISLEDLILHKMIAGRNRDLADVNDMLLLNPTPDLAYLRMWAPELGVSDALEERLSQHGPDSP